MPSDLGLLTFASVLRRGRQLDQVSASITVVALAWAMLQWPMGFGSRIGSALATLLVLVGILQKVWAARVALDADLFEALGQAGGDTATDAARHESTQGSGMATEAAVQSASGSPSARAAVAPAAVAPAAVAPAIDAPAANSPAADAPTANSPATDSLATESLGAEALAAVAPTADTFATRLAAMDTMLVGTGLMPAARAGRPLAPRLQGALRLLVIQASLVGFQVAMTLSSLLAMPWLFPPY